MLVLVLQQTASRKWDSFWIYYVFVSSLIFEFKFAFKFEFEFNYSSHLSALQKELLVVHETPQKRIVAHYSTKCTFFFYKNEQGFLQYVLHEDKVDW